MTPMALSPDTLQAVPKESWVIYRATMMAQMGPFTSPASGPKTMYRKGRAVIMDPPGAPGEATMATPRVIMKGTTVCRPMGSWFIRHTAVAQAVMVIMEPAMWMLAHRGTTKLRISGETPSASAHCRFTGMVAAEDWVPRAVI